MNSQERGKLSFIFLIVVTFIELFLPLFSGDYKFVLASFINSFLYVGLFYFFLFKVFRDFFFKKNVVRAVINFITGATLFIIANYLLMVYIVGHFIFPENEYYTTIKITNKDFLLIVVMRLFTYSFFAYAFWTFEKLLITQKEKAAVKEQKLKVEYNYLKSQINPHFLYNTLSFFYSRMLKQDKQAANGVAALSDIMRYSLEGGDEQGKVMLEKEVEQIENYILLQQLRFDGQLHIQFEYNQPLPAVGLLPHLLITIVENAFKHGATDDAAYPLCILLKANETGIDFTVKNKKSGRQKDSAPGGIGLRNLQERLQLAYPGKHSYEVKNLAEDYITHLQISV